MPFSASSISSGAQGIGGAVNDLFARKGAKITAAGLRQAAAFEGQNADLSQEATGIKQLQADRLIFKTIGGQQADIAAAGFGNQGSAFDLMADSAQEGALTKGAIDIQGDIDYNQFKEKQQSYLSQAKAQDSAAKGFGFSAIFKAIAGIASFIP